MRHSLSRSRLAAVAFAVPLAVLLASGAGAQIIETRQGEANPMVSVFKSTVYGGAAGLLLGLAVELVDEDGGGDTIKWGFVTGTFFGFGYGIYHVSTRPEPGALLEGRGGTWVLALPGPELVVRLPDPAAPLSDDLPGARSVGVRARLATLRF